MNLLKLVHAATVFSVAFCFFFGPSYAADTYYVDGTQPDDTGDGTSWAKAEKTISDGIAHLSSGDTLKIKSGTYNEPMIIEPKKPFDAETTIETDDGAGNPGRVIITGSTTENGAARSLYIHNGGQVTLDGRQSIREGQSTYGFVLSPTQTAAGVYANDYGANGRIRILRTEVKGNKPGVDIGSIEVGYAEHVEIGFCYLHQSGGYNGDVILVYSDPDIATISGSIHNNEVTGNPSDGYGGITMKRTNAIQVYDNYIYGLPESSNAIINRDSSLIGPDGGNIFNNVIYDSGVQMYSAVQIRGFSTGTGGTDNCSVYNNTIIMDAAPISIFFINDPSDGNKLFNNMIISNQISTFVASWNQNQGRNNSLAHNHVTGNVSNWFESTGCEEMFSSSSPNDDSLGPDAVLSNGAKPSPFYHLSTDIQGTAVAIDSDFDGKARDNPPTVGAFEHGTLGTLPPKPPTNLRIIDT